MVVDDDGASRAVEDRNGRNTGEVRSYISMICPYNLNLVD